MRRILKMLARLYPAVWRERYGAEYEALIEDAELRARDGFDVFWGAMKMRVTARSFVRIVLPCALLGGLVAVGISLSRPAMYQSQTLVTVETNQPEPLDRVLAGRVQEAWATPLLESMIQRDNLYPLERMRMPVNEVVNLMRKNIRVQPLQTKSGKTAAAFVVRFDYPDPQVAQRVDEELVSQLAAANLRALTAPETTGFLEEQLKGVKDPATKARIESQLRQSEDAASRWHGTLAVLDRASLPMRPVGMGRVAAEMIGLLAGLVSGMIAAALLGSRRDAAEI
jgi:hypothetical protein